MDIRLVVYRKETSGSSTESQYELDLQKSPNIVTNYKWIDISKPEERKSNFSQTIKIPFSNRNNEFFENWFDVNLATLVFSTKVKFSAVIMVDSIPQLEGYIQLKAVYFNARLYEVVVFGDTANFFTDIKDKKLRDAFIDNGVIDRQLDHFNTTSNIASSWESPGLTTVLSTTTNDVMYPIIDYGHTVNPYNDIAFWSPNAINSVNVEGIDSWSEQLSSLGCVRAGDLKPAIRIQKLLHLIAQKAGYSIKSTFLGIDDTNASTPVTDTNWFSRMFMTLANQYKSVRTKTFGGFKYTCTTQNIVSGGGYMENAPNWSSAVYDPESLFATGTSNIMTIPYIESTPSVIPTGDITIQVTLDISFDTADSSGASLVGASWFIIGQLIGNSNDYYNAICGYDFTGQITTQNNYEYVFTATIPQQFNVANSQWEFQLDIDSFAISGGATATSTLNSGTIEILNVGDSMFSNGNTNAEVLMTENMPDITQADFIKDLINRFNLIIQSDSENPNLLLIEPYEDYINSGATQYWTDKLDVSKEQVVKSTNEIQSKELIFSDLPDKDYFNDSYYKAWEVVWGSKNKFNRNDFASGEFKNFSIFSPFIAQGINSFEGNNDVQVAVASCFEIDEESQQRKPMEAAKPKLFYYSGTPITLSGYSWDNSDWSFRIYSGAYTTLGTTEAYDTNNKFPLCTQYNLDNLNTGITSTTKILNWSYYNPFFVTGYTTPVFGEGVSTLGLYNEHWGQYINEIYSDDARIMECYLKLDEGDIFNFSFANPVYIKNTLWRVLSIDNYLVGGNKSTKVTLLKAIEKLTYDCEVVPNTFNVNGTISFVNLITGLAADVTNECCENLDSSWTFQQTNNVTGVGNCYHNQWSPTTPQDVQVGTPMGMTFGEVISNDSNISNPSALPMPILGATENTVQLRATGNFQATTFYMYTSTKDTAIAYFGINGMSFKNLNIPENYMVSVEIQLMGTVLIDQGTPANVGNVGYFTYTTLLKNQKNTPSFLGTSGGDLKTSNKDTNFPLPNAGFTNFEGSSQQIPIWKPSVAVTGTQKISWLAKVILFMQPIPQDNSFHFYYALYQNGDQILFENNTLLIWN